MNATIKDIINDAVFGAGISEVKDIIAPETLVKPFTKILESVMLCYRWTMSGLMAKDYRAFKIEFAAAEKQLFEIEHYFVDKVIDAVLELEDLRNDEFDEDLKLKIKEADK